MHCHRLLVAADDDTTDQNTARALKLHAASNPDFLKGCGGSLVMQILQTLDDARVEFNKGCLVQAVDIDLPHLLRPTLLLLVYATMPIATSADNQMPTDRLVFGHCHRMCPAYLSAGLRLAIR